MDALWDCLYYSFAFPTTIILKNIEKLPPEMNEAVQTMLELFEDLQLEDEKVTVHIKGSDDPDISSFLV